MKHILKVHLVLLLLIGCGKKVIETKPVEQSITETVFATGSLEAEGTYHVTAQTDGYLVYVNIDEGSIIKKGDLLAQIENSESPINLETASRLFDIALDNSKKSGPILLQAEGTMKLTKLRLTQDSLQAMRNKRLLESNSLALVDYENSNLNYQDSKVNYENALENYKKLVLETKQQLLSQKGSKSIYETIASKNTIKAYTKGRVYKKLKELGDFVKKGDNIAIIGDPDNLFANVNIDESNIDKLKIGQHAYIQLNTQKDIPYKAEVLEILPQFDDATRSFICKLKFIDPLKFKIVGTLLQCNIIVDNPRNALTVPRKFVDFNNTVQIKGKKERTKITTKVVSDQIVEIINGLTKDDVILTEP